jgi:hypothetical protein
MNHSQMLPYKQTADIDWKKKPEEPREQVKFDDCFEVIADTQIPSQI